MKDEEVIQAARGNMGPLCKSCPVCNGKACGNTMPGPGAKGSGLGAIRNYEAWQKLYVNMDTLTENVEADTTCTLFGKTFRLPVFAGPVGHVDLHYGDKYDDVSYNDILIPACKEAGIAAFTGDGMKPLTMEAATQAIAEMMALGFLPLNHGAKKLS